MPTPPHAWGTRTRQGCHNTFRAESLQTADHPYGSKLFHDHPKPCNTSPRPPIARARPDPYCSKLLHDHPKPCKTSPRPPIARARPDPYLL